MRSRTVVAFGVLLAAAPGCSADPKGELMLAIATDMAPPTDFDTIGIEIFRNGQPLQQKEYPELGAKGLITFPATKAIVANDDPSTPIEIRISTRQGPQGTPRTLREALTTVPADRVALLRLPIEWLCLGSGYATSTNYVESRCPEATTCIGGACLPWDIDASELPTYEEGLVFGGGSPKGEGGCFDTLPCFDDKTDVHSVDPPPADCTLDKPLGSDVNVALVTKKGEGGICGPEICLVPLDFDTPSGWHQASGKIVLPPGICAPVPEFAGTPVKKVAVSRKCKTKTAETPTCGPWSAIDRPGNFDAGAPDGAL